MEFFDTSDLTYDVREIRIQAIHVEGTDPSLSGVQIFVVREDGQWGVLATYDVGPFDSPNNVENIERACCTLVHQILG
jgi:hypothetical protein